MTQVHEVRWGPRARLEIKKSAVLQIVSNLYKVDPKCFKQQYDQVVKEEGRAAMAVAADEDEEEEEEDEEGMEVDE